MHQSIPTYARFQWINHPVVRKILVPFFRYRGRGRRGYDKVTLFLWLMAKQCMRCSYRDLEGMSGIDYSTFVKFRSRSKERMPRLFGFLASSILKKAKRLDLILDSSFVETYSKHKEEGSAYSGYKEKDGFKTHEIIDFKTRVPLFVEATAGNVADIKGGEMLLDRAPPSLPVRSFSADKGYDSEYFVHDIFKKWKVKAAIPVRRFKNPGNILNQRTRRNARSSTRVHYRRRTEIERHFARKKRVFNLGEEQTRHFQNFKSNTFFVSILQVLEWLTKQSSTAT